MIVGFSPRELLEADDPDLLLAAQAITHAGIAVRAELDERFAEQIAHYVWSAIE